MKTPPSNTGLLWSKYRCHCGALASQKCVCSDVARLPHKMRINDGVFHWCEGRCHLPYEECLKKRNVDVGENNEEMRIQERRALTGLFSKSVSTRLTHLGGFRYVSNEN